MTVPPPLRAALLPLLTPPHPPLALFVHAHPSLSSLLSHTLPSLLASATASGSTAAALVDAVEFGSTPRSFMEEILRQWGETDAIWRGWEAFLEMGDREGGRILVVDRAERLRTGGMGYGPGGLGALMLGLGEMAKCNITVVLVSSTPWDYIRPLPATFPDPAIISLPAFTPTETLTFLLSTPPSSTSTCPIRDAYYPAFLAQLHAIVAPVHPDPLTLVRMAHALWPVWAHPLLAPTSTHALAALPTERGTLAVHLGQRAKNAFVVAVADPTGLPRSVEAFKANPALVVPTPATATSTSSSSSRTLPQLPRLARFLLVASFLASYNPPKKDLAFFGRGRWEEGGAAGKRRRRGGPAPTKRLTKKGSVAKIPQTLLGPKAFPLDRLIAIFGALLAEHDRPPEAIGAFDSSNGSNTPRQNGSLLTPREERWEEEVGEIMGSVAVRSSVTTLIGLHLLLRAGPADRLEGMTLRTGIGWDDAVLLGKGLGIRLEDFWAGADDF